MVYVVPHPEGWAVLGEGNCRVTSVQETQEEAMGQAQKIMQKWKNGRYEDTLPNPISGKTSDQ